MHFGYLIKHLDQACTKSKDGLDMEIYATATIKEYGQFRLQIIIRSLVADEQREMRQRVQDQSDIGLKSFCGFAHEQIN
jgi:hypothetical protein